MATKLFQCGIAVLLSVGLAACSTVQSGAKTSVVDYLYPAEQAVPIQAAVPVLTLPVKLGIAFVPGEKTRSTGDNPLAWVQTGANSLPEAQKMRMLSKIAEHFRARDYVADIQIIPSPYLTPKGGFNNLDQIKTMYGIDVIALVSYDQVQFTDDSKLSLSYWTLVGAYLVEGQKNDTNTLMDTVVYAIDSRKMLFRAPGTSQIKGRSTPVNLTEELRADSLQGFNTASEDMVINLALQLELFTEQLKQRPDDIKIVRTNGYKGGGSFNLSALFAILILLLAQLTIRRIRLNRQAG
jgi:rhombotail lipoprotein